MGKRWSSFFQVSVFRMLSSEAATLETFTYKKLSYQSHSPNLKPPRSWNQNGQQQKRPTSPYSWNKKITTTTKKTENRLSMTIGSMYGMLTYIYHKNQPNVSIYIYTIHGSYGLRKIPHPLFRGLPCPTSGTGASTVHFKSPSWRSKKCPRKMMFKQG